MVTHISLHKKKNFPINDFFSKFDQIRILLRIWSHLSKRFGEKYKHAELTLSFVQKQYFS